MMRRMLFGLLFFPLMACSGVFAQEALRSSSNPAGAPEKLPPIGQHHPKNSKPVMRTQHARPGLRSLPLSSPAAYAFEHPTGPPISPAPKPMPPPGHSWTGFYIGGGSGLDTARP
jgi:hypothetical protein